MNNFKANQIIISDEYNKYMTNERYEYNAIEQYMAHNLYAESLRRATELFPAMIPFTIKKVTECFVFFTVNGGICVWQKKLRKNERGYYFVYDDTMIYCENIHDESIIEECILQYEKYANALRFAKKTIEIEDFGYTYLSCTLKVTSIEEMEKIMQPWK